MKLAPGDPNRSFAWNVICVVYDSFSVSAELSAPPVIVEPASSSLLSEIASSTALQISALSFTSPVTMQDGLERLAKLSQLSLFLQSPRILQQVSHDLTVRVRSFRHHHFPDRYSITPIFYSLYFYFVYILFDYATFHSFSYFLRSFSSVV